jgi:hypothetical protein
MKKVVIGLILLTTISIQLKAQNEKGFIGISFKKTKNGLIGTSCHSLKIILSALSDLSYLCGQFN